MANTSGQRTSKLHNGHPTVRAMCRRACGRHQRPHHPEQFYGRVHFQLDQDPKELDPKSAMRGGPGVRHRSPSCSSFPTLTTYHTHKPPTITRRKMGDDKFSFSIDRGGTFTDVYAATPKGARASD